MSNNTENMSYEQAIGRLDEIVTLLDKNEIPLEKALELFEEGTRLTVHCTKILNEAKQKIVEIEKE